MQYTKHMKLRIKGKQKEMVTYLQANVLGNNVKNLREFFHMKHLLRSVLSHAQLGSSRDS